LVAAPTLKRLPFLTVLAWMGLILGSFGSLYGLASAAPFFVSHDAFVAGRRADVEQQLAGKPPTDPERVRAVETVERAAEALYARRGAIIPLAILNFVLSMMLFVGCGRALRRLPSALSLWVLAAALSVPYTVLDGALGLLQARDLEVVFRDVGDPLGVIGLKMRNLVTLFKAALEVSYFTICVIYLRRPELQRAFAATTTEEPR
jgi:hypothetical protein